MLVYAAIVYAMIALHEPWRDEAQAWLIARDRDAFGVMRQMRWELTPPLWHFLLFPFAKAGFPYWWSHFLNASIAVGSVALMAFASPFARWQKLVFAGCFLMAYEYSVIARSYGLAMLLGLAVAAFHAHRLRRPGIYGLLLLGLGASSAHGLILAGALALVFTWELLRERGLVGSRSLGGGPRLLLTLGVVGACVIALSWRFAGLSLILLRKHPMPEASESAETLTNAFFSPYPLSSALVVIAVATLALVIFDLRRNIGALIGLLLPLSIYLFTPLTNRVSYRHSGFVLLATLIALWTTRPSRFGGGTEDAVGGGGEPVLRRAVRASGGFAPTLVFACLAATLPASANWLRTDATSTFSNSRAMALYIREQGIEAPIAAKQAQTGSALLPYLPGRSFWYVDAQRWGTYVTWTASTFRSRLSNDEVFRRLDEAFGAERPWLLTDRRVRNARERGYALVHHESRLAPLQRGIEIHWLYRPLDAESQPREVPENETRGATD